MSSSNGTSPRDHAAAAAALFGDWEHHVVDVWVPNHFPSEVISAFLRASWRGRLTTDEAREAIRDLLALPFVLCDVTALADRAFTIAHQHQQRAYDCLYVALAEREGSELWTGDERLYNALHAQHPFVRWIADYQPHCMRTVGETPMGCTFPTDREAKRQVLLEAVERVRDTVLAGADAAEVHATLPLATVQALDDAGLLALKLPAVLGGAEADLGTQLEVLEAVTYLDTSAGWCTLIGAAAIASLGAFLADEAIAQIFANGQVPRAAGAFMPSGQAVPVAGGYRVSGRWAFASGIRHAQWVSATARVVGDGAAAPALRRVVMPVAAVHIHDNWQVMGLQGTGSCDFSVTDLFVPERFSWDAQRARPQRGGPLYRLGMPAFVANEHVAFALGVGRRALDTLLALAHTTQRGYGQRSTLAARPAVQRVVGASDLRLRAARTLALESYAYAWATVCAGHTLPPRIQAELRSIATLATDVALEVTTQAFRYSGGTALYATSVLQRCLRDIHAAAQHLMVSEAAYENYGQCLLGLPDADPMR